MAASSRSIGVNMTPVSISSEVFAVSLDNATFVDLTPAQIISITDIKVQPLNAAGFTNYTGLTITQFGNSGVAFTVGEPKVRIVGGAGAWTAATFLVTIYGTTA